MTMGNPAMGSNGIFGSGVPTNTPTTSIFGSTPSASSSLFGNTTTTPTSSLTSSSLFGNQPTITPSNTTTSGGGTTSSLFGGNQPTITTTSITTPTPTSSIFGTNQSVTSSLFGGNQTTTPSTTTGQSSLFGNPTTTTTQSLFGNPTTDTTTQNLFGQNTNQPQQQSQPQQPQQIQYNENTKFSELPVYLKQELTKFNQELFNSKTICSDLRDKNSMDFGQLKIEIEQIASNIESITYNFNFNIRSFKIIEESLTKPLSSINVQFNLLSTSVLTSFQQQQIPSREMEEIVDDLVQKLERIKNSLNHILPHYQINVNGKKYQHQSLQQSFISTLDNNQRIIQSEAIYLATVLKDLERLKKQLLNYKQTHYQDSFNPFKQQHQIYRQQLKKQSESIISANSLNSNSFSNSSFLNSSNNISQNSVYGGGSISSYGTNPQQQQQQPQQPQQPQLQLQQTPTSNNTSIFSNTNTNTTPTLSLGGGGGLFGGNTGFNTNTTPTLSLGGGNSTVGSTASSLYSTTANTISGVSNPLSSIASNTTSLGNNSTTNSLSVSNQQPLFVQTPTTTSSSIFNPPPKTPILTSQTNTFLQANQLSNIPSFSISSDNLLTKPTLSSSSSSISTPKKSRK